MRMRRRIAGLLWILLWMVARGEAGSTVALHVGWKLQSACKAEIEGSAISSPGFKTVGWMKTTAPQTVLAAQVENGVFPDPYFGQNLRQIPGTNYPVGRIFAKMPMAEDSPYRCGWWYRTEFTAPPMVEKDSRYTLHFDGINYRAEVWLNGRKIADKESISGAYRRYELDVTEAVRAGGNNVLAVETFAPTEKDLGINWVDWNPAPPDKNMGLWGAVRLERSGPVTIGSPLVVTHFQGGQLSTADLAVYAELRNNSDHAVKGILSGIAAGAHFEQLVELPAQESREISFSAEKYPELSIKHPTPWWPRQMGEPHLEQLTLRFTEQGKTMDETSTTFGIREIASELTAEGSRLFRINGKPLLIRGAGWASDMLLREDERRLHEQFRMIRDLNLNTIRLEGKLETEAFYKLADEQGLLVMAGWCCCDHWEDWKNWSSDDLKIATESLRAQMLRLRAHPSLLVWLNGSDGPPIADVERAYLQVEAETHWPNPILSSASAAATSVSGQSGVKMTGPYDYVAPSYWYVDKKYGGGFGFNTETSPGAAIPSRAGRARFLPDPDAWPPTANWSLHYGGGKFLRLDAFNDAMEAVYAKPHSAEEYERMAQTMAYDTERAMFEAYSRNKYRSTGVIQWMLNNAWPSMIWHLYDYSLEAGGGYYAVKKACELLHIQYAYDDRAVDAVNSSYERVRGLSASLHVYSLDGKEVYSAVSALNLDADSVQRVFALPSRIYAAGDSLFFIDLKLKDNAGREVSRNFYWVPTTLTSFDWSKTDYTHTPALWQEDMTALTKLSQAKIEAHLSNTRSAHGQEIALHLSNPSPLLAFQVRAVVRTAKGGLIAPVFWSDNWIELTPGESRTLTALLPETASAVVELEGWNVARTTLKLEEAKGER